jgi:ribosomal subunit interface protein
MQLPIQVTFRHMGHSDAIEAKVRERAEKLNQFYDHIMSCRVIIEPAHKHKHKGNLFQVRIDVTVPGNELVVSREPDAHQAHQDVYVSIRDAFDAMRRQLEDFRRRQRGHVKTHEVPPHGRITQLVPAEDYGMITTMDGREVYFHRNSVFGAEFDKLELGNDVCFAEEAGEKGPQASTVHPVGKHHVVG